MTENRDCPATGVPKMVVWENDYPFETVSPAVGGLTKREAAAISIAAGISASLANDEWKAKRAVAHAAVQIADALFDVLEVKAGRDRGDEGASK